MAENKPVETSSNEEKIIGYIETNKKLSEENMKPNKAQIDLNYALYSSKPTKRPHEWMSNRFIPATFKTVETILANIMGALYSTNPPFDIKPREAGDKIQARIMKSIISYQFTFLGMYIRIQDFVKQCLIYGTSYAKIYWDKSKEPRTILKPKYGYVTTLRPPFIEKRVESYDSVREDVFVRNNPTFDVIDIRDIFLSPATVDIQDSWVIHRKFDTFGNMMAKASQGIYDINRVKELKDVDLQYGNEDDPANKKEDKKEKTNELTHRVEILEFWGKVPLKWIDPKGDKNQFINAVITLGGTQGEYKVIRRRENPFWHGMNPFVKITYIRKPKEATGWGIPDIIGGLNLTINDIVNSRQDNMMIALQKVFIGVAGEFKTGQTIFPGAILTEENVGSLRDLNMGNITPSAYSEVFELERYLQEASGATKVLSGIGGGGAKEMSQTATGMSLTFRAAATRMMMHAKQIEFEAIKSILQRFYQLDHQYLTPEDVVRIVGQREGRKYVPLPPDDVFKDYDFIPAGTFSMENRDFQTQNMIAYLKVSQGSPYVNQGELIKKIGVEGFKFPADDPIFPDEEQVKQNIQRLMEMNQAGIGQGEGRPAAKPQQAPAAGAQTPANLAGGAVTKGIIK